MKRAEREYLISMSSLGEKPQSNKRHLFITGSKGSGKSTLLRMILEHNNDHSGIITRAIRGSDNVPECVLLEDIRNPSVNTVIGVKNQQGNGVVPCLNGFEVTGVNVLKQCISDKSTWIVIDEIGFLENEAINYQEIIRSCLKTKRVLAVLRKGSAPFIDELRARQDAFLIDLDNN